MSQHKMLYFIRHAEGEANVSDVRLGAESPLTSVGRQQGRLVAQRCVPLRAQVVFSSPVARALETSSYISSACGLETRPLDLFRERRKPTELEGRSKRDPKIVEITKKLRENFHLPGWRFSDEENFDELKERGLQILAFLESQPEDRIVVVSHGILIRIIVACAIHGHGLTGEVCEASIRGFRMEKSGVTALSVNYNIFDEGVASKFQLWMWNDYSHLTSGGMHASTLARAVPAPDDQPLCDPPQGVGAV